MKRSPAKEYQHPNNDNNSKNEALRRSKYQRQATGIDGTYFLNILEEIVIKEERL